MTGALTSLYRSLAHHRLFALLNIGGLALGIAAFVLLGLFVRWETDFDRHLPGWDKVWVVQERYSLPGYPDTWNTYSMQGELDQLRGDFPDLAGTRFYQDAVVVPQNVGEFYEDFAAVDGDFFSIMRYPVVAGDPARTIATPDGLVITQKIARKFFGSSPAIGRVLPLRDGKKTYLYRVGAVLADMRADETFTAQMFGRFTRERFGQPFYSHWGSTSLTTLLQFPNVAAADAFAARLPGFLDRHAYSGDGIRRGTYEQSLAPLASMRLADQSDRAVIATLGVVGLLTLGIAVVNYINLATARAGLRAREVAMRKVLGGTRRALVAQFLGEAVATVALSALAGLALAELALPVINLLGDTKLKLHYIGEDGVIAPLMLMVLVVGVVAGIYPALVLSRYQPAAVLASARAPGGGRAGARLRQALVVFQFAIAIAFAIGTAVMVTETAHLRAADLGFRRDGLLVVQSYVDEAIQPAQRAALLDAFGRIPGVTGVTVAQNSPAAQYETNTDRLFRPETPARSYNVMFVPTGPDYFRVYGAPLLAGRLFDRAHGEDDRAGLTPAERAVKSANAILNVAAVKALGFASPADAIGKAIRNGDRTDRVIGVVGDMRFRSPRDPMMPMFYTFDTGAIEESLVTIRYAGADDGAMHDAAQAAWRRVVPTVPFHAVTAARQLDEAYYKADAFRARLFTMGAGLAVLIGCIGLYGLAAFDTARRVKEIGIRKTLGASTGDVLRLLLERFMRPVLGANLVAWPLAWVAMRRWLAGFDDRIALSPLFFIAASVVAALIAAGTVLGQSWRVARAEPARALRQE